MTAATPVACGPATRGYEYVTGVLRSLLPLIERSGIATVVDIDIESLAERLGLDALTHEWVMFLPRVVGAWTTLPDQRERATP